MTSRDAPGLAPASQALGALAALLAALPLVVGGLWADLLPAASAPALDGALGVQLALAVWALPTVWAGLTPATNEPGRLGRAAIDLALVVGVAAPFVALAARFSSLSGDAVARGVLHALALLAALAAALALAGPRTPAARMGLVAAWTAAAPLLAIVAVDQLALTAPVWLAAVSPALGQQAALEGRVSVALLGVVLVPLALVALARRGDRGTRAPSPTSIALAACLTFGLGLAPVARAEPSQPKVTRADPLLRDNVRPGEPWPLRLELDAGGDAWLVAAGGRTRVVVQAASGAPTFVAAIPTGGGPIELTARALASTSDADWLHLDADLPPPRPLRTQELLVGSFGARMASRALAFAGVRRAQHVPLEARDAGVLAESGHALALILVAQGAARDPQVASALRLWAAAGGVAAFDHAADLAVVAGQVAAPGRVVKPWEVRPIGAGLLVGPAPGELGLVVPRGEGARDRDALARESAALERLAGRLRARSRRDAVVEAALATGPPGPSRDVGRRAALAALCAAVGLVFSLLAVSKVRRATAAGALLVAGLALALVLPRAAAPPSTVWAASTQVLEAPAGASAAGRLEVLTLAAPGLVSARVDLEPGGVPMPALLSAASPQEASIFPGERPALEAPVGPTHRAFVRQDAVALPRPDGGAGGAFRLTRGRAGQSVQVENATDLALDRVLAITSRGVYALGDLAPGAVHEQDLDLLVPPIPFARWRLASDASEDERAWRLLVTAALAGRDLTGQLVLVGRGPPVRRVGAGVAGERPARPLVVITASEETSPR